MDKLRYISKDFHSILQELINISPELSKAYTPQSENDPMAVNMKNIALVADMLAFYLDKQALETAPATMTQRKVADAYYRMMGYYMEWYRPASTTLRLVYDGVPGNDVRIPKYTQFQSLDGSTVVTYVGDGTSVKSPKTVYDKFYGTWSNGEDSYIFDGLGKLNIIETTGQHLDIPYTVLNGVAKFEVEYITKSANIVDDKLTVTYHDYDAMIDVTIEYPNYKGDLPSNDTEVEVIEGTVITENLGSNYRILNNKYELNAQSRTIVMDTVTVIDDSDSEWVRVDDIDKEPQLGKFFDVYVNEYDKLFIRFSPYINQITNNIKTIKYVASAGVGSAILPDILMNGKVIIPGPDSEITSSTAVEKIKILGHAPSSQSTLGPETPAEAYLNSRKYINTCDTLVTPLDYENAIRRIKNISNCAVTDTQLESIIYPDNNLDSLTYKVRYVWNNFDTDDQGVENINAIIANETADYRCIRLTASASRDYFILEWMPQGTITLSESVTEVEAEAIIDNICSKLASDYHPSKLKFGTGISIVDLSNKIKSYDDRIMFVDIKPIEYKVSNPTEYKIPTNNSTDEIIYESGVVDNGLYQIYKRFIIGEKNSDGTVTRRWHKFNSYDKSGNSIDYSGLAVNTVAPRDPIRFMEEINKINENTNILIANELDPSDFFNASHPYNQISIPRFASYKCLSDDIDERRLAYTKFRSSMIINKESIIK